MKKFFRFTLVAVCATLAFSSCVTPSQVNYLQDIKMWEGDSAAGAQAYFSSADAFFLYDGETLCSYEMETDAIADAVTLWSPVIITGRIPAF